jgi:hypothetical protein
MMKLLEEAIVQKFGGAVVYLLEERFEELVVLYRPSRDRSEEVVQDVVN